MKKSEKKKHKQKQKEKERREEREHDERHEDRKRESVSTDDAKRLNRILGQLEGIRNMVEDGRELNSVLTQCKAVHSALRSFEMRLLTGHLNDAMNELERMDKRKSREQRIDELVELYRQLA